MTATQGNTGDGSVVSTLENQGDVGEPLEKPSGRGFVFCLHATLKRNQTYCQTLVPLTRFF